MKNIQTAIVKYQIAIYSGTIKICCEENDDSDYIIAKAKAKLQKENFPFGYQNFKIIERY